MDDELISDRPPSPQQNLITAPPIETPARAKVLSSEVLPGVAFLPDS
ncbi:MAG: hypothetical protein SNJ57_17505 [Cyanobacteriota bacterium]